MGFKMNKKYLILGILILLAILIVIAGFLTITLKENNSQNVLGDDDLGTVKIEGPFGNNNSSTKIAYIIGTHPLENNSHTTIYNLIKSKNATNSLNKCYYIYIINVSKNRNDFDKGRLNGQILGQKYVVPHAVKEKYDFVVDIHSHRGVYEEYNFIIAPLNDNKSELIGRDIISNITNMTILKFVPASDGHPTSPDYISIPILKNGTPTLIYETYLNESTNTTKTFIIEFFENLDNLNFNNISITTNSSTIMNYNDTYNEN